jgi:hypothetical protein
VQPLPDFHQAKCHCRDTSPPQFNTQPVAPHFVIPAQAGIQRSPRRGTDEFSTNGGQDNFTIGTPWKLAWVPAYAGMTIFSGIPHADIKLSRSCLTALPP